MNNRLIAIKGNIHILCNILKFVVTYVADTKLSALFMNAKEENMTDPCQIKTPTTSYPNIL